MGDVRGDEWYTPRAIVEALGEFDMDPAAPRKDHWTAKTCFTKEDNGLEQEWKGRVFMNPPYSDIDPWIFKMTEHGNGIVLVFARMGTRWMDQALCFADAVCFLDGRIKFVDLDGNPGGTADSPSILLAFGDDNVEAIARAIADGKIDGRLYGEIIPQIFLNERDPDFQKYEPTEEDYRRWAEEDAANASEDEKRIYNSKFEKWRRRAAQKAAG